jgi:hypothetical protein
LRIIKFPVILCSCIRMYLKMYFKWFLLSYRRPINVSTDKAAAATTLECTYLLNYLHGKFVLCSDKNTSSSVLTACTTH